MSPDVTLLLERARNGDPEALDRLVPIVYDELRALARSQRHRRGADETLNTTALVHEAYERMAGTETPYVNRQHFFRVAARVMRSVIVDRARAQSAQKRGGKGRPMELDEERLVPPERAEEVIALDEALSRLSMLSERQGEVVQLRYFVGLTIEETAEVLSISPATVKREWTVARAWLHDALVN
ncbi:MAG: sigma-70 family RNA polymerase sigma factor [Bacteroidota bacterium]